MKNFHVPIKTTYKGVEYRSRLEAKWAVFFDKLGFYFSYEKHPVKDEQGNVLYMPDFYVYKGINPCDWTEEFLIEIKPVPPNQEYLDRLAALPLSYTQDVLIMVGEPNFSQENGFWLRSLGNFPKIQFEWIKGFKLEQCSKCTKFDIMAFNEDSIRCYCDRRYNSYENALIEASKHRFDI